ncbi:hypothetical protein BDW59DRAFT_160849 [Aspergillus cavernicola]|uniref:SET domain-containing protein n=1 Tax=Aspergillus cavernicola TaxID=176166 RepID=A0ABR4IFW1_9EURO
MLSWIHPHLTQSVNPIKGRQLQASKPIQRGEVLLIDPPYAIIPTPTPAVDGEDPLDLICSNPHCSRLIQQHTGSPCPNRCTTDVAWCSETCRQTDQPRHAFECTWLSKYATSLRSKWGEFNFGMLWLIVRILARRDTHTQLEPTPPSAPISTPPSAFQSDWPAISSLCGTPETWSHAQVREWTIFAKKYLSAETSSLTHGLSAAEIVALICKEEANSFGLYPRETGCYPPPTCFSSAGTTSIGASTGRGEQFGAAVYPRASIANHSCCPNIIHKPDKTNRMVFTAGRDIAAGEECCITYFDLSEYIELQERRGHLRALFRFRCGCARCVADQEEREEEGGEEEGKGQWDFGGME